MTINFKLFFKTNEIEDCGWCTIKNNVNENNVELITICCLNKLQKNYKIFYRPKDQGGVRILIQDEMGQIKAAFMESIIFS